MIGAIVFDFDGTILETEEPDLLAWQELYLEYGHELPLSMWLVSVGGGADLFDAYGTLERLSGGSVDRESARSRRRLRFRELVAQQDLRPGVAALIEMSERRGLRLGIASSSSREWVVGHLQERKLIRHFATVCTADDVTAVKPDPELYRRAVANLGVAPGEALAIEDSVNGVLAAKRAGLFCVAVPNAVTAGLDLGLADLRLESLAGVTLDELLGALGQDGPLPGSF